MPKALVINPNTSPQMTDEIRTTAQRVFQSPWSVDVVMAPGGPESLESWTDYALASVSVLPLVADLQADGVVLACFGDPGLFVLKESVLAPVVGIAEASMSLALLLGDRFGILAGMDRAVALMDSMVRTYGLVERYAGTQSLNMRVLEFEKDREHTLDVLASAAEALRGRGAEVLLLGCAGLTGFMEALQERVGMTVIDPVAAGCLQLQAVAAAGLQTSSAGLYSRPAPQRMNRMEALYSSLLQQAIGKLPRS